LRDGGLEVLDLEEEEDRLERGKSWWTRGGRLVKSSDFIIIFNRGGERRKL